MKSTSHFAIAHLIFAALQTRGVYLNRVAFVYGNIAPDYDPNLLIPTHFTKTCERMLSEISYDLSQLPLEQDGRVGAEYSKRLGILCHFLCDYYCRAHNKNFEGGLKQHTFYENSLDQYLRHNCMELFDIGDCSSLDLSSSAYLLKIEVLNLKGRYLSAPNTLQTDLEYAYAACLQCISSLVAISQKNIAPHSQLWLDDLIARLKGYATGESLVFRMFFYKNRNNNIFFLPDLMPPICTS